MNVVFIHPGVASNMGSSRKRATIPSKELNKLGWKSDINIGNADIVVFGKPGNFHYDSDPELAKEYKSQGAKIVVDICDDHLNHPEFGPIYNDMMDIADLIICPTVVMRDMLKEECGRNAEVIDDPYEEDETKPHPVGNKAFWWGHNCNYKDILKWKDKIIKDYELSVMSGPKHYPGTLLWSPEAQTESLHKANIALFPTSEESEYKTSNRVVDAIRAGCFPVCSYHPSYREFRQVMWVGNLYTGMQWASVFQDDLTDLVLEAQGYIRDRFSPKTIGERWKSVLESI